MRAYSMDLRERALLDSDAGMRRCCTNRHEPARPTDRILTCRAKPPHPQIFMQQRPRGRTPAAVYRGARPVDMMDTALRSAPCHIPTGNRTPAR